MNFNQMRKIRQIRAASFGQLFGLLVLLSGFIASTEFRAKPDVEVSLLGEQIIDYVDVRQMGFIDLTVESPKEISTYGFLERIVVDIAKAAKAGSVAISS